MRDGSSGQSQFCPADLYSMELPPAELPQSTPKSRVFQQLYDAGVILPELSRDMEQWVIDQVRVRAPRLR